jgi:DNA-binding NarL/FixJ family response regulator
MKQRIRVLIADDEAPVINTFRNILVLDRENDFVVDHESSPDKVLAGIEHFQPHIVLLDNQFADKMVGIDDLLPRIAGQFPAVKVIIVTGQRGSDTDQIMRAIGWNADAFLDKAGLDPELLKAKILRAFAAYQLEARKS